MSSRSPFARFASLAPVVLLVLSPPLGADEYPISAGGAQLEVEVPLPLPSAQPATATATALPATGTAFPPLGIPVNADPAQAVVQQTAGPDPKKLTIAPGALRRAASGPRAIGLAGGGVRKVFQVQTEYTFSAPALAFGSASAQLSAGGRTGAATATFVGVPPSSLIRYSKSKAQFGGPLHIGIRSAPDGAAMRVWTNPATAKAPCKHPVFNGLDAHCTANLYELSQGTLAAPGAPVGFVTTTRLAAAMSPAVAALSVPKASGRVAMSASLAPTGAHSQTGTIVGFPWTTGMLTVSAGAALGTPEMFSITGMDSRVNGVGTLSLVSGSLGDRSVSGAHADRGWLRLTLPEPAAALGAAAALAALAACHGLLRRRTPARRGA